MLAAASNANFGITGIQQRYYYSRAAFEPEVCKRPCRTMCANFGFAAPARVGAIFTSETGSVAKLGEKQMGATAAIEPGL